MSHSTPSGETPLLARKGGAAPAGMVVSAGAGFAAEPAPRKPQDKEPRTDKPPSQAPAQAQDAPPPASLLPIDFSGARFREVETDDRLRLLPTDAGQAVPDMAATDAAVPLQPEPRAEPVRAAGARSGVGLGALAAAIAVVAVASLAVWRLSGPEPESVAAPEAPAASHETVETAPSDAGGEGGSQAAAVTSPSAANSESDGETVAGPAANPPEENEKAPADATPQTAAATIPSVDVVDLQPDGSLVIAGRAAPGSELIVLDGDEPIGTARADAYGDWVLIPDRPLPVGEHAFGLVIKEVHGTVLLPAPDSKLPPAEPAAGEQDESRAPVPPRKPERAAAGADPAFVVQLASVKTRDGAVQEWEKLKARFPGLLADKKLTLQETEIQGRGPVVRVRAGPFADHSGAADFCADLVAGRQDCLVVQTDGGS